jgi:hypothetical protein
VAEYALDGPFEPADDTPRDSSGLGEGTVSVTLTDLVGSFSDVPVELVGPIAMWIDQASQGSFIRLDPFVVRRALDSGDLRFYDQFLQGRTGAGNLRCLVTVLQGPEGSGGGNGPGRTLYHIQGLNIVGYRLERGDDGTLSEVLELSSVANTLLERFHTAVGSPAVPLTAPLPGGIVGPTGPLTYAWSGAPAGLHSAGALPDEASQGPAPLIVEPVSLLVNALADHPLFTDFMLFRERTFSLRDAGGALIWPLIGGARNGMFMRWELRQASDGGVYEVYEIQPE